MLALDGLDAERRATIDALWAKARGTRGPALRATGRHHKKPGGAISSGASLASRVRVAVKAQASKQGQHVVVGTGSICFIAVTSAAGMVSVVVEIFTSMSRMAVRC
jgi:hypothetical protein